MKSQNKIYYLSMIIIFMVNLIAFSFAFLSKSFAYDEANLSNQNFNDEGALGLTYSNESLVELNISGVNLQGGSNEYTSFIESQLQMDIVLKTTSSYPLGATCKYQIEYNPKTVFKASDDAINNKLREFTILGTNGTETMQEYDLSKVTKKTIIYEGVIKTSGVQTFSQGWHFDLRFYILEVDQRQALGQKPSGTITIIPGECEENI